MSEYRVALAASARKELNDLPGTLMSRVLAKLHELATDPRPRGCKKLEGYKDLWRVRIGDYRILYVIDDRLRLVDVTGIRHRREAYRPS